MPNPLVSYSNPYGADTPTPAAVTPGSAIDLVTPLKKNLLSALQGELPPDVINLIQQRTAEAGVGSGLSGSELIQNRGLRDLGLTSLNRMQFAEGLLAPHAFQPWGQPNNNPLTPERWNPGTTENRPPLRAAPNTPSAPTTPAGRPNPSSNVGDLLAQYLNPSKGGLNFSSPMGGAMRPMGSGTSFTNSFSSPGFYAGSQGGYDAQNLEDLVGLGIADPSWGAPNQTAGMDTDLQDLVDLGIADPSWANSFIGDIGGYDSEDFYG